MTQDLFLNKGAWENTVYVMTTTLFNTHIGARKNTIHAFKQPGQKQPLWGSTPPHQHGAQGGPRLSFPT